MNIFYSWNTKKVGTSFVWTVSKVVTCSTINQNGRYADTTLVKSGTMSTRTKAVRKAQQWKKYLTNS